MALEQTLFAINFASSLLLVITMIFLIKNKSFEVSEMENSLNTIIFGVFFLLITTIINTISYAQKGYPSSFASIQNFETYVSYLTQISELVLIPLFAICFLVGIYLAKEKISLN